MFYVKVSETEIEIKLHGDKITHLKISVMKKESGISYATYQKIERGYYLSVIPISKKIESCFVIETSACFTGFSNLIVAVPKPKRFSIKNQKVLESTIKSQIDQKQGEYWDLINVFCQNNNIDIVLAE